MALRDLFSKRLEDKVTGTRVLTCSLDQKFGDLLRVDSASYSRFYPAVTAVDLSSVEQLSEAVKQRYDIVHLFCEVSPNGMVSDSSGNTITGTLLIEKCCNSDVKLLWVANENEPEGYIEGFNAAGKRINLVMTISRNGLKFSAFFERLLSKLSSGEAMPVAWATLVPQAPGPWQDELPSCIFSAGRSRARLR